MFAFILFGAILGGVLGGIGGLFIELLMTTVTALQPGVLPIQIESAGALLLFPGAILGAILGAIIGRAKGAEKLSQQPSESSVDADDGEFIGGSASKEGNQTSSVSDADVGLDRLDGCGCLSVLVFGVIGGLIIAMLLAPRLYPNDSQNGALFITMFAIPACIILFSIFAILNSRGNREE